jgi:hypothetical protein
MWHCRSKKSRTAGLQYLIIKSGGPASSLFYFAITSSAILFGAGRNEEFHRRCCTAELREGNWVT